MKVANNLFKQVVRDAKYDVAELRHRDLSAGQAYDKPYVLLPAVLVSRGQHHTIAYNPERGPLKPSDLNGKGRRARLHAVTTGTWVRGILASDYGVDIDKVEWITFEEPHVAEYRDPAIVKRAPEGKELAQMLLDGEVAAGIVGDKLPDPELKHPIPPTRSLRNAGAPPRRSHQSHGGGQAGAVALTARRGAGHLPPATRKQTAAGLPDRGELDPYRYGVEACRPILKSSSISATSRS